jgi:hypothetical protein
MTWYGFIWTGTAWERVCTGDDLGECHRRLNRIADDRGVKDSFCVMTGGGAPTFVPVGTHRLAQAAFEGTEGTDDPS